MSWYRCHKYWRHPIQSIYFESIWLLFPMLIFRSFKTHCWNWHWRCFLRGRRQWAASRLCGELYPADGAGQVRTGCSSQRNQSSRGGGWRNWCDYNGTTGAEEKEAAGACFRCWESLAAISRLRHDKLWKGVKIIKMCCVAFVPPLSLKRLLGWCSGDHRRRESPGSCAVGAL